jgi:hypothetical protein
VGATVVEAAVTGLAIILNHIGAAIMVAKVNGVVVDEVVVRDSVVDAVITGLAIILKLWAFIMLVKFRYAVVTKVVVWATVVGAAVTGLAIILKNFGAIIMVAKVKGLVVIVCWSHFI